MSSPAWEGPPPRVSVVVPTHNNAYFLAELVAALEAQTFPRTDFEAIVVDDASTDQTWDVLQRLAAAATLRLKVARLAVNEGPGAARNAGALVARGDVLVFTDDDCLPSGMWLDALVRSTEDGIDVVQGRTLPEPTPAATAWPRSVWITSPTPLFESCNLAVRRQAFEEVGGFGRDRTRTPDRTRQHFGEDAEMGWRIRRTGRRTGYSAAALVHHRQLRSTYHDWIDEQRRNGLFPDLVRRIPELRPELVRFGVFLSDRTALFDLAVAGAVTALVLRRPWIAAAGLPWLRSRWREAGSRPGMPRLVRIAQLAVGDAVALFSLLEGSLRTRQVVL